MVPIIHNASGTIGSRSYNSGGSQREHERERLQANNDITATFASSGSSISSTCSASSSTNSSSKVFSTTISSTKISSHHHNEQQQQQQQQQIQQIHCTKSKSSLSISKSSQSSISKWNLSSSDDNNYNINKEQAVQNQIKHYNYISSSRQRNNTNNNRANTTNIDGMSSISSSNYSNNNGNVIIVHDDTVIITDTIVNEPVTVLATVPKQIARATATATAVHEGVIAVTNDTDPSSSSSFVVVVRGHDIILVSGEDPYNTNTNYNNNNTNNTTMITREKCIVPITKTTTTTTIENNSYTNTTNDVGRIVIVPCIESMDIDDYIVPTTTTGNSSSNNKFNNNNKTTMKVNNNNKSHSICLNSTNSNNSKQEEKGYYTSTSQTLLLDDNTNNNKQQQQQQQQQQLDDDMVIVHASTATSSGSSNSNKEQQEHFGRVNCNNNNDTTSSTNNSNNSTIITRTKSNVSTTSSLSCTSSSSSSSLSLSCIQKRISSRGSKSSNKKKNINTVNDNTNNETIIDTNNNTNEYNYDDNNDSDDDRLLLEPKGLQQYTSNFLLLDDSMTTMDPVISIHDSVQHCMQHQQHQNQQNQNQQESIILPPKEHNITSSGVGTSTTNAADDEYNSSSGIVSTTSNSIFNVDDSHHHHHHHHHHHVPVPYSVMVTKHDDDETTNECFVDHRSTILTKVSSTTIENNNYISTTITKNNSISHYSHHDDQCNDININIDSIILISNDDDDNKNNYNKINDCNSNNTSTNRSTINNNEMCVIEHPQSSESKKKNNNNNSNKNNNNNTNSTRFSSRLISIVDDCCGGTKRSTSSCTSTINNNVINNNNNNHQIDAVQKTTADSIAIAADGNSTDDRQSIQKKNVMSTTAATTTSSPVTTPEIIIVIDEGLQSNDERFIEPIQNTRTVSESENSNNNDKYYIDQYHQQDMTNKLRSVNGVQTSNHSSSTKSQLRVSTSFVPLCENNKMNVINLVNYSNDNTTECHSLGSGNNKNQQRGTHQDPAENVVSVYQQLEPPAELELVDTRYSEHVNENSDDKVLCIDDITSNKSIDSNRSRTCNCIASTLSSMSMKSHRSNSIDSAKKNYQHKEDTSIGRNKNDHNDEVRMNDSVSRKSIGSNHSHQNNRIPPIVSSMSMKSHNSNSIKSAKQNYQQKEDTSINNIKNDQKDKVHMNDCVTRKSTDSNHSRQSNRMPIASSMSMKSHSSKSIDSQKFQQEKKEEGSNRSVAKSVHGNSTKSLSSNRQLEPPETTSKITEIITTTTPSTPTDDKNEITKNESDIGSMQSSIKANHSINRYPIVTNDGNTDVSVRSVKSLPPTTSLSMKSHCSTTGSTHSSLRRQIIDDGLSVAKSIKSTSHNSSKSTGQIATCSRNNVISSDPIRLQSVDAKQVQQCPLDDNVLSTSHSRMGIQSKEPGTSTSTYHNRNVNELTITVPCGSDGSVSYHSIFVNKTDAINDTNSLDREYHNIKTHHNIPVVVHHVCDVISGGGTHNNDTYNNSTMIANRETILRNDNDKTTMETVVDEERSTVNQSDSIVLQNRSINKDCSSGIVSSSHVETRAVDSDYNTRTRLKKTPTVSAECYSHNTAIDAASAVESLVSKTNRNHLSCSGSSCSVKSILIPIRTSTAMSPDIPILPETQQPSAPEVKSNVISDEKELHSIVYNDQAMHSHERISIKNSLDRELHGVLSQQSESIPKTIQVIVIDSDEDIDRHSNSRSTISEKRQLDDAPTLVPSNNDHSRGQRTSIGGRSNGTTKSSLHSNLSRSRHQLHHNLNGLKHCNTRDVTETTTSAIPIDYSNLSKYHEMFGDCESIDTYSKYWHRNAQKELLDATKNNTEQRDISNTMRNESITSKATIELPKLRHSSVSLQSMYSESQQGDKSDNTSKSKIKKEDQSGENDLILALPGTVSQIAQSNIVHRVSSNGTVQSRNIKSSSIRSGKSSTSMSTKASSHQTNRSQTVSRDGIRNVDDSTPTRDINLDSAAGSKVQYTYSTEKENDTAIAKASCCEGSEGARSVSGVIPTITAEKILEETNHLSSVGKKTNTSFSCNTNTLDAKRKAVDAPELYTESCWSDRREISFLSFDNIDIPCPRVAVAAYDATTTIQRISIPNCLSSDEMIREATEVGERMQKALDPPCQDCHTICSDSNVFDPPAFVDFVSKMAVSDVKCVDPKEGNRNDAANPKEDEILMYPYPLRHFGTNRNKATLLDTNEAKQNRIRNSKEAKSSFDANEISDHSPNVLKKKVDPDCCSLQEHIGRRQLNTRSVHKSQSYERPSDKASLHGLFSLADFGTDSTGNGTAHQKDNNQNVKVSKQRNCVEGRTNTSKKLIGTQRQAKVQHLAEMIQTQPGKKNSSKSETGPPVTQTVASNSHFCLPSSFVGDEASSVNQGFKGCGDDITVATSIEDVYRPDRYAPAFYDDGEQCLVHITSSLFGNTSKPDDAIETIPSKSIEIPEKRRSPKLHSSIRSEKDRKGKDSGKQKGISVQSKAARTQPVHKKNREIDSVLPLEDRDVPGTKRRIDESNTPEVSSTGKDWNIDMGVDAPVILDSENECMMKSAQSQTKILKALYAINKLKSNSDKLEKVMRKLSEHKSTLVDKREETCIDETSIDESNESRDDSIHSTFSHTTEETQYSFADSLIPTSRYAALKEQWRQQQQQHHQQQQQKKMTEQKTNTINNNRKKKNITNNKVAAAETDSKRSNRVTFDSLTSEVSLGILESQDTNDIAMDILFGTCNHSPMNKHILLKNVFGWP